MNENSSLDRARDELMSHVVRCDVLQATMADRQEWLGDTLTYMKERYPSLSELQCAQLEMIGRQFIEPVIPHGQGNTAINRAEPLVSTGEGETEAEVDATEVAADYGVPAA